MCIDDELQEENIMTEKVWIDISGVRTMDGEKEQVKEIHSGDYYKRNGKHYIIGSENDSLIKRIKVARGSLSIVKNGAGNEMVFEKGKNTSMLYEIPPGNLVLEIQTQELEWYEEKELLKVNMTYGLYHNGSQLSDNCIEIKIYPRDS